ncbi:MAG TPA: tripartite tricarboxylate transporter substrate binding protein [Burkholderiales bacterium]|nr:tripartite tricarboxylate transporter substrate binding protein [Burkholderiales bacterium]
MRRRALAAAAAGLFCAAEAPAQSYPVKPIRVVAAGSPAGSIDFIARIVGQKVAPALGQPMVVENRGGAGGNLGAEVVARAAPDGYTLLVIGASVAINPHIYTKLTYDPAKDLAAVTQTTSAGFVLAVHPTVPARTVQEFVTAAKASKAGIAYASPGIGQAQHLGMELLKNRGGFKAVHVPYKGGAPAVTGVVAGEADITLSSLPAAVPLMNAGKLKAIAVSSLARMPLLPAVPTVAESGFPGFEVNGWIGYFAPAGVPREIAARVQGEIAKALRLADVQDALKANGQQTVASTPDAFAAYFRSELVKWGEVARLSGARAD